MHVNYLVGIPDTKVGILDDRLIPPFLCGVREIEMHDFVYVCVIGLDL